MKAGKFNAASHTDGQGSFWTVLTYDGVEIYRTSSVDEPLTTAERAQIAAQFGYCNGSVRQWVYIARERARSAFEAAFPTTGDTARDWDERGAMWAGVKRKPRPWWRRLLSRLI